MEAEPSSIMDDFGEYTTMSRKTARLPRPPRQKGPSAGLRWPKPPPHAPRGRAAAAAGSAAHRLRRLPLHGLHHRLCGATLPPSAALAAAAAAAAAYPRRRRLSPTLPLPPPP